jgi:GNAT superfamily N-acetyltransferase
MGVRVATSADVAVVSRVAARGFYDDPVMGWVFPDDDARLGQLEQMMAWLFRDYVPGRGLVHVLDEASVSFWREPGFEPVDRGGGDESNEFPRLPGDVLERLGVLNDVMTAAHPHDAHWYLNVIATMPARQGEGLGRQLIEAVSRGCDRIGSPAYLESSNPTNMTLYRRQGFEQTGELELPGGPSLYPMWREPR